MGDVITKNEMHKIQAGLDCYRNYPEERIEHEKVANKSETKSKR